MVFFACVYCIGFPLVPLVQQIVIVEMLVRELASLERDLVKNIVSWCSLAVLKLMLAIDIVLVGLGWYVPC